MCFFWFLFCKQKAAYEMRISDWSSDVCSSDLEIGQQAEEPRPLDGLGEDALLLGRHRGDAARHDLAALGNEALQQLHVLVVDLRRVGAGERAGLAAAEERPPAGLAAVDRKSTRLNSSH